ncbi:MAG: EAL domain-containing protein [Burkholderiaceae bacterium]
MKTLAASIAIILGFVSAGLLVSQSITDEPDGTVSLSYLPDPDPGIPVEEATNRFFSEADGVAPSRGLTPEGSFWISLTAEVDPTLSDLSIELRQLRGKNPEFWQVGIPADSANTLAIAKLAVTETRSGIAFEGLHATNGRVQIVGRLRGESVVKPQVVLQPGSSLAPHLIASDRLGGLLFGGMLGLAVFGAIVSLLNRDKTFFLLAALLVTSLRIAGFNFGWDLKWIGWVLDARFVPVVKNLTLLLHLVLTVALFQELFGQQIQGARTSFLLPCLYVTYLLAAGLTLLAPAHASIVLIWVLGVITTVTIFLFLAQILRKDASPVAIWYALSWFVTGLGMFGEIVNALGYPGSLTKVMNSQVAAISAAVLSGIALAAKLQHEREARISAQHSAVTALQRFRENYNAMPVGIFSMKHDGTLIEHNPTFAEMFPGNGRRNSKIGLNWVELTNLEALKAVKELTSSDRMMDTELAIERPDGKRRWFHVRAVRKAERYEGWIEEITARKEAEGQLKFLVDHDSLTGLLNRRGFEIHLQKAIGSAGNRPVCLAYVDLDRFKLVNDLFGHAAGDQILRQMATRMREVIRPPHVAARVGGDEFVVIIDGPSLESAKTLCEKLRVDLSDRAYQYQDKAFNVTASIGLIRVLDNMRPADALTASDRACSEAKTSGGATVISYDSSSTELLNYLDEIKLVAGMKERLPIENFFTQLQPIVSLRNPESSLCYEVLIRMRDNSGQVLPPARFIPAAERNGLMTQIDRWVLRSTLEWLDSQPAHRDNVDFCTLNLSGASLNDEKFLQDTIALIRSHPESTRKICFEITESVALYDLNTTRRFVDRVKSFGAMVALDDFGAGYTSFSYLKELPGDLVKIDGNFIRDVNLNRANFAITRAVVDLAHELGMGCVAEWAENAGIVKSLIELQVDYAQGYGVCRPLDRERLLAVPNAVTLIRDQETADIILGSAIGSRDASRRITLPI